MSRGSKIVRVVLGCALLFGGFCGIVSADDTTGRWGLDGMIGGVTPVGPEFGAGEVDYEGYAAGAGLRYGLNRSWGLEAAYEDLRVRKGIQLQPLTLSLLYSFSPANRLTPYVSLGAGYAAIADNYDFNRFVARAGLGLEYFFSSAFSGRLGASYHVTDKTYETDECLQAVTGALHLTWWWGCCEKATVQEKVEQAVQETVQAPVAPPAPVDSDGDGVIDSIDRCPGTPAGTEVDAMGCPLPKPEPIVETPPAKPEIAETAESVTLEILFDTGKAVVKPEFAAELSRVAVFLKKYPAKQALIEGHSDSVGNDMANLALSQKRADSVRTYLVEILGVDGAQVKAQGFGESKPIADNATKEGRAQNRRVVASFSNRAAQ